MFGFRDFVYVSPTSGSGNPGAPIPASWTQADWFIDPVNGSDVNDGKTALTALKTYGELWRNRWQTTSPLLNQRTTIHFISDAPNLSDPVVLTPFIGNGGAIYVIGLLTQVAGPLRLGATTAKNRSTGTPLSSNLGAGAATYVGLMIVNTDRTNSVAWVDSQSANVGTLTQPVATNAPASPANYVRLPAENDNWALNDHFTIQQPTKVAMRVFRPTCLYEDSSFNNLFGFMGNVWVIDQSYGPAADPFYVNDAVLISQSRIDPYVEQTQAFSTDAIGTFTNCWCNGAGTFQNGEIWAGACDTEAAFQANLVGCRVDGDCLMHGTVQVLQAGSTTINAFGFCFLDGTVSLFNGANVQGYLGTNRGVYGTYTINVQYGCQWGYATNASGSFLGTPTLQINGQNTGASAYDATNFLWDGARTVTVAHLDAAIAGGGFNGNASRPEAGYAGYFKVAT